MMIRDCGVCEERSLGSDVIQLRALSEAVISSIRPDLWRLGSILEDREVGSHTRFTPFLFILNIY